MTVTGLGMALGLTMVLSPGTASPPEPPRASPALAAVAATSPTVSATILIDPDAGQHGYSTPEVTISPDGTLSVADHDAVAHTVTSVDLGSDGLPLFDARVEPGQTRVVPGATGLTAGSYAFYCRFHPNMRGTLTVQGDGGGTTPTPPSFDQPLVLPRALDADRSRLRLTRSQVQVFASGPATWMWTFDGTFPGPTLTRRTGRMTRVRVVNDLGHRSGRAVSVHLHGDHHPARYDGQPDSFLVRPGAARTYRFPLRDAGRPIPGATMWYHDHRMGRTGRNVWRGLAGMMVVRDPRERRLDLPRGRYDVPLMLSERSFSADHTHLSSPRGDLHGVGPDPRMPRRWIGPDAPPNDATLGDYVLVNGRYAPYADVDAHRYRLRLVNASNFSSYNLAMSDGRPFTQIGTGNGLLPHPVQRQQILLGPAQRVDVVVDFGDAAGRTLRLDSVPMTDGQVQGIGPRPAQLMEFRVGAVVPDDSAVPSDLATLPPLDAPRRVAATWSLGMKGDASHGTAWTINGRTFDPDRDDYVAVLGTTETWLLRNDTSITHYLHLHEELWRTVSRDGHRPPPWERGYEDTWRLDPGEYVKVVGTFSDYPGRFMVHCHMLDHEDHGLMAQFRVVRPGSPAAQRPSRRARAHHTAGSMASMPGM